LCLTKQFSTRLAYQIKSSGIPSVHGMPFDVTEPLFRLSVSVHPSLALKDETFWVFLRRLKPRKAAPFCHTCLPERAPRSAVRPRSDTGPRETTHIADRVRNRNLMGEYCTGRPRPRARWDVAPVARQGDELMLLVVRRSTPHGQVTNI